MEYQVGKNPCKKCGSSDAFHFYGVGKGGYCWSCQYTLLSDDEKEKRGIGRWVYDDEEDKEVATKEIITPEELEEIYGYTGESGQGQRGITDETYQAYRVRFKYDEVTGEVCEVFYGYTQNYQAAGFKVRKTPIKDFYSVGKIGKNSELFGQWKWKDARNKYVLLTAGELDALSAYQILENYRKSRNSDFDPIPVVSSAIGETGSYKQVQLQYQWLDQFERIIVCYDNDEAGQEALADLFEVIPKGKMFVMKLSLKDTNEYLTQGKEKAWIKAFYDAPAYTPVGVLGSGELSDRMDEEAGMDKIKFPPFMSKVNKMTAGGIALGKIVNVGAASGIGKSVYVDQITEYWIFNCPYLVGIVSMEANAGQYGLSMLSRYIGRKIMAIEDKEERKNFLASEPIVRAKKELFYRPDGTHRFYLVDDRDGSVEELQKKVEELVIKCGCKIIVLDPLQDILDGMSIEDQSLFLKWQKGMIKSHNMTFFNINHVRKSGGGQKNQQNSRGAMISEEDFAGSSTIFKSGALNILLVRDKMAEDEFERNTTKAFISKNRDNSVTGPCGEYYYDSVTHKLWDMEDWMEVAAQAIANSIEANKP